MTQLDSDSFSLLYQSNGNLDLENIFWSRGGRKPLTFEIQRSYASANNTMNEFQNQSLLE